MTMIDAIQLFYQEASRDTRGLSDRLVLFKYFAATSPGGSKADIPYQSLCPPLQHHLAT